MQARNNTGEEKFFYANWWPLKEKEWTKEDIMEVVRIDMKMCYLTKDLTQDT